MGGIRKRRPRGNNRPRRRRPEKPKPPCLPCIPEDVLLQVFHKLPLKSFTRFKSTCRKWNSILSDPQFIHQTLNHRLGSNHHLVFFNPDSLKLSLYTIIYKNNNHFIHDNQTSISFSPLKNMFNPSKICPKAILLGTCNGVVALLIRNHQTCVLCNPLTGEYTSYNIGHCFLDYRRWKFQVGLCYDASCDEYILVIVVKHPAVWGNFNLIRAWFVNFKHGRRRMIGELRRRPIEFVEGIGKVVCGNLHWIYQGITIVYFDVKKKRFNYMNLPAFLGVGEYNPFMGLVTMDGDGGYNRIMGLATVDGENQLRIVLGNKKSLCLDVWVMKEYGNSESWIHLFKIPELKNKALCLDVLGFMSSRELLIDMGMNGIWVCDSEQQQGNLRQVHTCSGIDFTKTYLGTYKPRVTSLFCTREENPRERKYRQSEEQVEEATTERFKKKKKKNKKKKRMRS